MTATARSTSSVPGRPRSGVVQAVVGRHPVDERKRVARTGQLPGRRRALPEHLLGRVAGRFRVAQEPPGTAVDGAAQVRTARDAVAVHATSRTARHPQARDGHKCGAGVNGRILAGAPSLRRWTPAFFRADRKVSALLATGAGLSQENTRAIARIAAMMSSEVPVGSSATCRAAS